MIQQVNLHQSMFQEQQGGGPSAARTLRFFIGVLSIMFLWSSIVLIQKSARQAELSRLELLQKEGQEHVESLRKQYGVKEKDPALIASVEMLREELDARRVLLSNLSSKTRGSTRGFSQHLVGLARRRVPGLWLTSIRLINGGQQLALTGYALKGQFVPRLLQLLREEPAFTGQEFTTFEMKRSEEEAGNIAFSLGSDPEEKGKGR